LVDGGAAFSTKVGAIFEHLDAFGTVLDSRSALTAEGRAISKWLAAFRAVWHQHASKQKVVR
jgi:hypothetical protein